MRLKDTGQKILKYCYRDKYYGAGGVARIAYTYTDADTLEDAQEEIKGSAIDATALEILTYEQYCKWVFPHKTYSRHGRLLVARKRYFDIYIGRKYDKRNRWTKIDKVLAESDREAKLIIRGLYPRYCAEIWKYRFYIEDFSKRKRRLEKEDKEKCNP